MATVLSSSLWPRCKRTISHASSSMLSAIVASTGGPGTCTTPSVARLSVIECAMVKAVMVHNSTLPAAHDQDQSKHEQQMVKSEKNVLDSVQDVGTRHRQQSGRGRDLNPRAG